MGVCTLIRRPRAPPFLRHYRRDAASRVSARAKELRVGVPKSRFEPLAYMT